MIFLKDWKNIQNIEDIENNWKNIENIFLETFKKLKTFKRNEKTLKINLKKNLNKFEKKIIQKHWKIIESLGKRFIFFCEFPLLPAN